MDVITEISLEQTKVSERGNAYNMNLVRTVNVILLGRLGEYFPQLAVLGRVPLHLRVLSVQRTVDPRQQQNIREHAGVPAGDPRNHLWETADEQER